MKHYDINTDMIIDVNPFYVLYWNACYLKFRIKVWLGHKIFKILGYGVIKEILTIKPLELDDTGKDCKMLSVYQYFHGREWWKNGK